MPSNRKSVHVCLFWDELLAAQLDINLMVATAVLWAKNPGDGCSSIQTSSRSCWHLVKRTKRQIWILRTDNETRNTAVESYVIVARASPNCHFWHPGHFTLWDTFAKKNHTNWLSSHWINWQAMNVFFFIPLRQMMSDEPETAENLITTFSNRLTSPCAWWIKFFNHWSPELFLYRDNFLILLINDMTTNSETHF